MTREGLRFMERIQFDDVKTDWRIFDPVTGEPMDLWLLVARDVATGVLLGFGMRPARVREDGSQEHSKLIDMKMLCAWLLERYGLPPYLMTWIIERGAATLSAGSIAALQETPAKAHPHRPDFHDRRKVAGRLLREAHRQQQAARPALKATTGAFTSSAPIVLDRRDRPTASGHPI